MPGGPPRTLAFGIKPNGTRWRRAQALKAPPPGAHLIHVLVPQAVVAQGGARERVAANGNACGRAGVGSGAPRTHALWVRTAWRVRVWPERA